MLQERHKRKIIEISPKRLHPLMEGIYQTAFPKENSNKATDRMGYVPNSLPNRNVQNIDAFSDRESMLEDFPKGGKVAELGVDRGDFSEKIISIINPENLFLIDVWDSKRYNEEKMEIIKSRFKDSITSGEVTIVRERSEIALERFEDDFFDWVYIDTTHSYEQTLKELNISRRKVKKGGIIAGHDYCIGNASKGDPYGVISAVHEFCAREDWEISYLSLETHGYSSFALEKLDT